MIGAPLKERGDLLCAVMRNIIRPVRSGLCIFGICIAGCLLSGGLEARNHDVAARSGHHMVGLLSYLKCAVSIMIEAIRKKMHSSPCLGP